MTARRVAGIFCAAALTAAVLAKAAYGAPAPAPVMTRAGAVQGVEKDGVIRYLGIPYAAPPVGRLRWRAPQPPAHWSGVRLADHFGDDCMQRRRPGAKGQPPVSEDCLYLNVWRPAGKPGAQHPVMVFLHGGGFFGGAGSVPMYDGSNLARQGVVLVNLNYRLGLFGFFAHPALTKENPAGPLGNYGLLDQIAALQWVQRNIAAFGGNPHDVTVFGESAGGESVNYLMASPYARGLFQRAIVESGVFSGGTRSWQQALAAGEKAARSWGAPGDGAAALRSVPAARILASEAGPGSTGPMVDGKVVPEDFIAAFEADRVMHIPYMIGSNRYEAGFFRGMAAGLSQRYAKQWPRISAVFDGYGTHRKALVEGQLATDLIIAAPTRRVARAAAKDGLPTYVYRYSYLRPGEQGKVPGPIHTDELYAVFGNMSLVEPQAAATRAIVQAVQSRWIHFALTGRPGGTPAWPAFTTHAQRLLDFTNHGPVVRKNLDQAQLDLAAELNRQAD